MLLDASSGGLLFGFSAFLPLPPKNYQYFSFHPLIHLKLTDIDCICLVVRLLCDDHRSACL